MSLTSIRRAAALLAVCSCTAPADTAVDDGSTAGIDLPDLTAGPEPERFDLPNDGSGAPGCSAVDLLFVLDNSASMQTHHQALAGVFPQFIAAVFDALPPGTDLHVGITTTDVACKDPQCVCADATLGCQSAAPADAILSVYAPPSAGFNGVDGSQGRLLAHDGPAYFAARTNGDPSELVTWFEATTAAVGELGCSFEMPVAAAGLVAAPANAPTNAGFIRDSGAALVVFVLTDEPDKSPESADTYADMLREAKVECGGDACITAAGIVPACVTTSAQTLWRFLDGFGEPPTWGDIADPASYVDVVERALVGAIGAACSNVPVP